MKLYPLLLLGLFMVSIANADLGTFKQGDCVNIKTILNATSVNISSISYPNGSVVVSNQIMTKSASTFNYSFCDTSTIGTYVYDYFDDEGDVYVNSFEITYSGKPIDFARAIVYSLTITLLLFFSLFLIWVTYKLPSSNKRADDGRAIQVSWLKYLRFPFQGVAYLCIAGVFYVSGLLALAYLGSGIGNILWFISMIMFWGVFPLIIIFFFKIFDDIMADRKFINDLKLGVDSDGEM